MSAYEDMLRQITEQVNEFYDRKGSDVYASGIAGCVDDAESDADEEGCHEKPMTFPAGIPKKDPLMEKSLEDAVTVPKKRF